MLLLLFLSSIFTQESSALSCAFPENYVRAYEQYDAVILGKVIKVEAREPYQYNDYTLTIKVEQSFKTITQRTIEIHEQSSPRIDQLGETYLFFLKKDGDGYINRVCSPTTNDQERINEFLAEPSISTPLELEPQRLSLSTIILGFTGAIAIIFVSLVFYRRRQ